MEAVSRNWWKPVLLVLGALALAACGGGGSSSKREDPQSDPTRWRPGVYLPASTFAGRCDTLNHNHWLRSWSDDTYLWYDELPDLNPANYDDPIGYFDLLVTDGFSPSGARKDNFHFTMPTEEWEQQSGSGVAVGYGFQLALLQSSPPRRAVVAYSDREGQWPAGIRRGLEVVSADGVNLAYGNDVQTLNAALFPREAGEEHTIVFWDSESDEEIEVVLTSGIITSDPVQNTRVIEHADQRVGYILFNDHIATAEKALRDAVHDLASSGPLDELVLDLRYNGGGYLAIGSQLAYMIAGSGATAGKVFEEIQFNDKHPDRNPVTGEPLEPIPFIQTTVGLSLTGGQPLPTLNLQRVFVLTGPNTCSASEAIINGLRGVDVEVVQIGAQTCGKPYGFYATGNCGTTYFTIQFKGANHKGFGEYADGFVPSSIDDGYARVRGCSVPDDFRHALGDESEHRFAAALNYIADETCGAYGYGIYVAEPQMGVRLLQDGVIARPEWRQNRIMLLPAQQ